MVMISLKPGQINIGGDLLNLGVPRVMGIVNVTPDSFYPASRARNSENIVGRVAKMVAEGADIIDVGGCSTRPGTDFVDEKTEEDRVMRALGTIRENFPNIILSVDTFRSVIAERAVTEYGVAIVNDISGGELDDKMFDTVQRLNVPYVLSHWLPEPVPVAKGDFVASVARWLSPRISKLNSRGVKDIIIDPGFGFGKTMEQNFELLENLEELRVTGMPLLVGLSRKTMIWKTLGLKPSDALTGTIALNTIALMKGADIIRVHDVREAVETVKLIKILLDRDINK
jgi:dihydropteroate synthase